MSRALDRQFLEAELAAVEEMLAGLHPDRVLERRGFESKRGRIREELSQLDRYQGRNAEVVLSFGGGPVASSLGIEAGFGSEALTSFRKAVSHVSFSKRRDRGSKNRPPMAPLHLTNVVRGSFGFELRELDRPLVGASELAEALDETVKLVKAAVDDEEQFLEAIAEDGTRAGAAIRDFFSLLDGARASLRVITDETDFTLAPAQIAIGAKRTQTVSVDENVQWFDGIFKGVLLESRQFEFLGRDGSLLRGKLNDDVDGHELMALADRPCRARIKIVNASKPGGQSRRSLTLLELAE